MCILGCTTEHQDGRLLSFFRPPTCLVVDMRKWRHTHTPLSNYMSSETAKFPNTLTILPLITLKKEKNKKKLRGGV